MYSKKSRGSSHSQQEEKFSLVYYSLWQGSSTGKGCTERQRNLPPSWFSRIQLVKTLGCTALSRRLNRPESLAFLKFPPYNKNNWQSFSPKPHTKNILCYSSPSPFWYIFTYFKAESLNLLSSDEVVSCIHKSSLGSKCPFSVCPPQVQMQPLTYRIATEQPGGHKKRIFN